MAFGQYLGYIVGAVGAVVGGVVGFYVGGPAGAVTGATWGFTIGTTLGSIGGQIFWPEQADKPPSHPPPQPHETRLQFSSWGMPIPIQYGDGRMAGNIIYMSDIVETIETVTSKDDSYRYHDYTKTYTSTFAIAFCEGPVPGVARIWMNNKVFADWRDPTNPYYPVGDYELTTTNIETTVSRSAASFSVYLGSATQTADTAIAAKLTAAETPAYRGICYIVFRDFPIGEFSGVPTIEIEVGLPSAPMWLSDDFTGTNGDAPKIYYWDVESDSCQIDNNTLLLTSSATNLAPRTASIIAVTGDFDVQVDWARESAYFGNWGIEFIADNDGYQEHYRILARWATDFYANFWQDSGENSSYTIDPTNPTATGQFRATKTRQAAPFEDVSVITLYYKNSDSPDWVEVTSWNDVDAENIKRWTISFVMVNSVNYYVDSMRFDNFVVN